MKRILRSRDAASTNRVRFDRAAVFAAVLAGLNGLAADAPAAPQPREVAAFLQAIRKPDDNRFRALLDRNPALATSVDSRGRRPLHCAAAEGTVAMVDALLAAGAGLEAEGGCWDHSVAGMTALHATVLHNRADTCLRLLQAGADPNRQDNSRNTPLGRALMDRHAALAALMLDHGGDPLRTAGGTPPLATAIHWGRGLLVPRMLAEVEPARRAAFLAEWGPNLMLSAAASRELATVEALLQAGVPPDGLKPGAGIIRVLRHITGPVAKARHAAVTSDPADPLTPSDPARQAGAEAQVAEWVRLCDLLLRYGAVYDVFSATGMGDLPAVRKLVANAPDSPHLRDANGDTPLHWSVRHDWPDLTTFWIDQGAALAATNRVGQTPLHLAAKLRQRAQTALLLDAGAPLSPSDTNGMTALDLALNAGATEVVRAFNERFPDAMPEGRGPTTPLHHAVASKDPQDVAAALREVPVDAPNEAGRTAFQLAVMLRHLTNAVLLLEHGANVNARDATGNTALHYAVQLPGTVTQPAPEAWLATLRGRPEKARCLEVLTGNPLRGDERLLIMPAFLIAAGADPRAMNHAGESVAQLAERALAGAGPKSVAVVLEFLASFGAETVVRDPNGDTALHRAARGGPVAAVAQLVAAGAAINATNRLGRTPLHAAVESSHGWPGPLVELLRAQPKMNPRDNEGMTPLHLLLSTESDFLTEAVRALLDAGADPSARDSLGRTPWLLLLERRKSPFGVKEVATALIEAGTDLTAADHEGRTGLHRIGLNGSSLLISLPPLQDALARAGVDPDARDRHGNTPLHLAAGASQGDSFAWLCRIGSRLNLTNGLGQTPLLVMHTNVQSRDTGLFPRESDVWCTAWDGQVDQMRRLIAIEPQLLNLTNHGGCTPLFMAADANRVEVARVLLQQGGAWDVVSATQLGEVAALQNILTKQPTAIARTLSGTPLSHLAAKRNHRGTLECLLRAGADLHLPDPSGRSCLGQALLAGHADLAQWLRQRGADESLFDSVFLNHPEIAAAHLRRRPTAAITTNSLGLAAIHLAAALGREEMLTVLLDRETPVDLEHTATRSTPLHAAIAMDQPGTAALLLARGANPNAYDARGCTPLHLAAVRDCLPTLRLLLGAGVRVNAPTHPGQARERSRSTAHITGHTALHLATWYRRTNSMRLLLEAGADPNAKGSTGLTPLGTIGASQRYANLGSDVYAGEPLRRTLSTGGVLLPHAGDSYIEQRSRTPAAFEILREAGGHEPD